VNGNPGAYLETSVLDTFAPQPRTTSPTSEFTGDYRAMGVTALGGDFNTFGVSFGAEGREMTLMLVHDNDTPGNSLDDSAAYYLGPNVPLTGQGWISYDYVVPSSETELPAGWALINLGDSGAPANHSWDEIIQHVSRVQYFYGHPEFFFIFQQWHLGMDNMRISVAGGVDGDVNGDGVVDVTDLLAVLAEWGACPGCAADLNGDGMVNVDDLLVVLANWS
jgi:hypothetical protein